MASHQRSRLNELSSHQVTLNCPLCVKWRWCWWWWWSLYDDFDWRGWKSRETLKLQNACLRLSLDVGLAWLLWCGVGCNLFGCTFNRILHIVAAKLNCFAAAAWSTWEVEVGFSIIRLIARGQQHRCTQMAAPRCTHSSVTTSALCTVIAPTHSALLHFSPWNNERLWLYSDFSIHLICIFETWIC